MTMVDGLKDKNRWIKNGFGQTVSPLKKFTREESELIRVACKEVCEARKVPIQRLCSECQHSSELRGIWMEIAKKLPHRSVQSVYRHGLRILHPFKRGPWTEDECIRLEDLVTKLGKKWVAIQKILNRSADACRDKYREMSNEFSRGKWDDKETNVLIGLIRTRIKAESRATVDDIRQMIEAGTATVPWSDISRSMRNRSRLSCYKRFRIVAYGKEEQEYNKRKRQEAIEQSKRQQLLWKHNKVEASPFHQQQQQTAGDTSRQMPIQQQEPESQQDQLPEQQQASAAHPNRHFYDAHKFSTLDVGKDPIPASTIDDDDEGIKEAEIDMFLLSELTSSGASNAAEVMWDQLQTGDARERWNALVTEWQRQEGEPATQEQLATLPLYALAQVLLDRKQTAKMAVETVEAVDLPSVII